MLSPQEIDSLERRLYHCVTAAGDTSNLSLVEVCDIAVRSLSQVLTAYRQLHDEHAMLVAALKERAGEPVIRA